MKATHKTVGIIMSSCDFKEADRLYVFYTKAFGKLTLRAQGVKKVTSKLAGSLEPYSLVEVFFAEAAGFSKIGGVKMINCHKSLKQEQTKLKLCRYYAALCQDLVLDGQQDERLFNLLVDFFNWADQGKNNPLVFKSYILKLLDVLGHKPDYSSNSNSLAKVLHFLSKEKWEKIQCLRLTDKLWVQLGLVINNILKQHLHKKIYDIC